MNDHKTEDHKTGDQKNKNAAGTSKSDPELKLPSKKLLGIVICPYNIYTVHVYKQILHVIFIHLFTCFQKI